MNDLHKRMHQLKSGEPVGDITPIGNGYGKDEAGNLYELESCEAKERKRLAAYKKLDKRHFTFSHMRNIREVTDNLSNKICGYILMLQPYVQYKTNVLAMPGRNPVPMENKDFTKALEVTARTVKSTLQELELNDVIEKDERGYYRMNERYHFRNKAGGDVDLLVKTFHTTLKSLKLKPAEMGFLYKLLPYIHYDTNLICENPFEEMPHDVKYLNKTQIAEKVGITREKAEAMLKGLVRSGALVTVQRRAMQIEQADEVDGRDTLVILNPKIFSRLRGDNGHDPLTVQMFAGI